MDVRFLMGRMPVNGSGESLSGARPTVFGPRPPGGVEPEVAILVMPDHAPALVTRTREGRP